MTIYKALILILTIGISQSLWADQPVKKSKSGICHRPNTAFYDRTSNYTAYKTIEACLFGGGKLPQGQSLNLSEEPSGAYSKPNSTNSDYSRSKFGNGWDDADRDCQNTRQEVLIEMSTTPVRFADNDQCRVTFGRWISMYSGEILFDASKVDIDHVVPLKWAWEHGADKWSDDKREQFANDPINLVAVEASLNRSKGAKGINEWLPPRNREQYRARFNRVLLKYNLIP